MIPDNLWKRLDEIDSKLDRILEIISNDVKPHCLSMYNHIQFVDHVIDKYLQGPIHSIKQVFRLNHKQA